MKRNSSLQFFDIQQIHFKLSWIIIVGDQNIKGVNHQVAKI